jgi:hypothetical protein
LDIGVRTLAIEFGYVFVEDPDRRDVCILCDGLKCIVKEGIVKEGIVKEGIVKEGIVVEFAGVVKQW